MVHQLHNAKGCAAWLEHSISAIRLHPAGGQIADSINSWYEAAEWVIDRASAPPIPRRLQRRRVMPWPHLRTCRETRSTLRHLRRNTLADELRERLLRDLDGKICTAAEIAHLSTYLGLDIRRDQVRKQNQPMAQARARSARKGGTDDAPVFRFGDVLALLAKHDTTKRTSA